MKHEFVYYSIALNEGVFYLVPEPALCPRIRNCNKEVYWGYITANTLNGGSGLIFPDATNHINSFMQDLSFEFRMGMYSKMQISFYGMPDKSIKQTITILPELQEPNKFQHPIDAINYIFPYLQKMIGCENIEQLQSLFAL